MFGVFVSTVLCEDVAIKLQQEKALFGFCSSKISFHVWMTCRGATMLQEKLLFEKIEEFELNSSWEVVENL